MIHNFISGSGAKTSIRAKIIFSLSLLIPFSLIFIYVWTTATGMVFRDDMYLIKGGPFENYLKGTLTFADLWRPSGTNRFLGYNILQLANIKWFAMTSRMIVLSIPFLMLASAIMIYREYKKSLIPDRSPEFIAATFFLLSLLTFNVIQWEGLINSYCFVYQSPMPFFIASFLSLELFLIKGKAKYWPAAFMLPAIAVLILSGTHCLAFIPPLTVTFGCYVFINRFNLAKDFLFRTLIISIFFAGLIFLYLYRISVNDYFPAATLWEYLSMVEILARPLQALQFLLASLGAGVVGVDMLFAFDFMSFHYFVWVGLIVVFFHCLALILFFKSQMHKKTYLPFFFIMQTFLYFIFMTVGRFSMGMGFGMSSHYTCISLYGLVAMVWIFIFSLTRSVKPGHLMKLVIYAGFSIIFSGLIITSIIEWRMQPQRKADFVRLHDIAMRVDTATPEELLKFGYLDTERTRESLKILRDHKLNVYHVMPSP
jgi:hypothetical protein